MDRLVVSSISGHVAVGTWDGEQILSTGSNADYLTPLNDMIDWRRKLSLFTFGKGHQFMTADGRNFHSVIHYLETQRHQFMANCENNPTSAVSFHSEGTLSSLSEKSAKALLLQSLRVLPIEKNRSDWVQQQRDVELEKALLFMYENNHDSRSILLQTGHAELWMGREFMDSAENDRVLDFLLGPCIQLDNHGLRRFLVLEKVRAQLRFAYWTTPEFQLGVLAPLSPSPGRKEDSAKRSRLESMEPKIEVFVVRHSMQENLHNLTACYLQQTRMDIVKAMVTTIARRFLIGKTIHEWNQVVGYYGSAVPLSLSEFHTLIVKDAQVHPLNVHDAYRLYLILVDYRYHRLPLNVILMLVQHTFFLYQVFQTAEELSMSVWLWCEGTTEQRRSLQWKYGPSVNRWMLSKHITALRWNPGDMPNITREEDYPRFFPPEFNEDINDWDVSSVTDMTGLFAFAKSFNRPLSNWKTGKVTRMSYMFLEAESFNQPLNHWDMSNVVATTSMFQRARSFNGSMEDWAAEVGLVRVAKSMFEDATSFNQSMDMFQWSSLLSARAMFRGASCFNGSIDSWYTPVLQDCTEMFCEAPAFNQPFSDWDVPQLMLTARMFQKAAKFNQSTIPWLQLDQLHDFQDMLRDADSFVIHGRFPYRELFQLQGKDAAYVFGEDHPFSVASKMYLEKADILKIDLPDFPSTESLKCSICWNTFCCPYVMSCGCTYCYMCVAKYYSTTTVGPMEHGIHAIKCPKCRADNMQYGSYDVTLSKIVDSHLRRRFSEEELKGLHEYQAKSREFMLLHEYSMYTSFYKKSKVCMFSNFASTELRACFRLQIEHRKACYERKQLEMNLKPVEKSITYIRRCLTHPFSAFPCLRPFFVDSFGPTHELWVEMQFFFRVLSCRCVLELAKDRADEREVAWWTQQLAELHHPCVAGVMRVVQFVMQEKEHSDLLFSLLLLAEEEAPESSSSSASSSAQMIFLPPKREGVAELADFLCEVCHLCIVDAHTLKCCGRSVCFPCAATLMEQKRVCSPVIQNVFECSLCKYQWSYFDPSFVCFNRCLETILEEQPDEIRGSDWLLRKSQSLKFREFTQHCKLQFGNSCEPRSVVYVLQLLNWFQKKEKGSFQAKAGVELEAAVQVLSSLLTNEQKQRLRSIYCVEESSK